MNKINDFILYIIVIVFLYFDMYKSKVSKLLKNYFLLLNININYMKYYLGYSVFFSFVGRFDLKEVNLILFLCLLVVIVLF